MFRLNCVGAIPITYNNVIQLCTLFYLNLGSSGVNALSKPQVSVPILSPVFKGIDKCAGTDKSQSVSYPGIVQKPVFHNS